jgi:formyltetrahydrofolate deformylase
MEVIITGVGPDNVGLADPIIHHVSTGGGNIAEIQMYDHDEAAVFAMLCRVEIEASAFASTQHEMRKIADKTGLEIRVWSAEERAERPKLALCTTHVTETPRAVLESIRTGRLRAEAAVVIGNRRHCESLAHEYGIPFEFIGKEAGAADDDAMVRVVDAYNVDYIVLARYMRILPPATCWKFAGGRIINLHHGLLPSFPGLRPYHDAVAARMLSFGATCHFIVPELDAGNQTIHQATFSVSPGTALATIVEQGKTQNEPACLVEGVRRVVDREVQLHFHRVVARQKPRSGI